MKTMWNEADRRELECRLGRLRAEQKPQWGTMSAPQMVVHLSDALRMAYGELAVAPKKLPIRYPPLKQLIIYCLPFPKGAPTAPELITRSPGEWCDAISELRTLMQQFATRTRDAAWPDHPAFGPLSSSAWGVLVYRHTDHHFRQFGI